MSDVSKFKIIDKIVNVKDIEGRMLISSNFNTLNNRINTTDNKIIETDGKMLLLTLELITQRKQTRRKL